MQGAILGSVAGVINRVFNKCACVRIGGVDKKDYFCEIIVPKKEELK